jgi:ABC-type spermidine/putrescine transport system permease subunit II
MIAFGDGGRDVLGALAAIGLTKANLRGKGLLMAIPISPMTVPVVVGVGMYLFFAPFGLANTYIGLILAHASLGVPFVVTMCFERCSSRPTARHGKAAVY